MARAEAANGDCRARPRRAVTLPRCGTGRETVGVVGLGAILNQLTTPGRRPTEICEVERTGVPQSATGIPRKPAVTRPSALAFRESCDIFLTRQGPDAEIACQRPEHWITQGAGGQAFPKANADTRPSCRPRVHDGLTLPWHGHPFWPNVVDSDSQ
jgi:hypothetical protein